ncbi:MAG: hypothetical protein PHN44_00120 [Candidatus Marinimicrobia bacterium]|nr:hypothetical protein [Candidatus Neomarinimicrobiota bacterium]
MFRLAKPLVPVIALTVLAAMLSVFVQPVWWIPLLAVPGYWVSAIYPPRGRRWDNNASYEDFCGCFGMLEVPMYEGKQAACNGITKATRHIIIPVRIPDHAYRKLKIHDAIKTMVSHELSHLYYNHPFTNVFYFTLCCAAVSFAMCFYGSFVALFMVIGFIPCTIWKTMQMEIAADRLADTFSDMRALLLTLPDNSIRKMRLAALDGKRS